MSKKVSLSFRQNPLGIQILDGKLNQTLQRRFERTETVTFENYRKSDTLTLPDI